MVRARVSKGALNCPTISDRETRGFGDSAFKSPQLSRRMNSTAAGHVLLLVVLAGHRTHEFISRHGEMKRQGDEAALSVETGSFYVLIVVFFFSSR